jgi:hypothetical protein
MIDLWQTFYTAAPWLLCGLSCTGVGLVVASVWLFYYTASKATEGHES